MSGSWGVYAIPRSEGVPSPGKGEQEILKPGPMGRLGEDGGRCSRDVRGVDVEVEEPWQKTDEERLMDVAIGRLRVCRLSCPALCLCTHPMASTVGCDSQLCDGQHFQHTMAIKRGQGILLAKSTLSRCVLTALKDAARTAFAWQLQRVHALAVQHFASRSTDSALERRTRRLRAPRSVMASWQL